MPARFAIIKVNLETKVVEVFGQSGGGEPPVTVYNKDGVAPPPNAETLGEVKWAQNSPGCVYWVGGTPVKVC